MKLLVVGGFELNDVNNWFDAGAVGIGIGSVLEEPSNGKIDLDEIESRILRFVKLIKKL